MHDEFIQLIQFVCDLRYSCARCPTAPYHHRSCRQLSLRVLCSEVSSSKAFCRGNLCSFIGAILGVETITMDGAAGVQRDAAALASWATAADAHIACQAIAGVLRDPRSSPETKGWAVQGVLSLADIPAWSGAVATFLLAPLRDAEAAGQVFCCCC